MKRLLLTASVLLLIGAGCANAPASTSSSQGEAQKSATATGMEKGQQGEAQKSATGTAREKGQQGEASMSATAAAQVEAHAKAAVTITPGGTFSPAVVTVKAGDTVTWTDQSQNPVRIASNPHPTHTDYPGFDSGSAIDFGTTYSFTFTKVGSWGYHNHFSPNVQGTVIVTP